MTQRMTDRDGFRRLLVAGGCVAASWLSLRAHASVTITVTPLAGAATPANAYIRADIVNCQNPTILGGAATVPRSRRYPLLNAPSVTITLEDNVTQIACSGNQLSYYTFTYVNGTQQTQLKSVELPPGGPFNLANLAPLVVPPFNPGVIQGPPGVDGVGCTSTATVPCITASPYNEVHWQNYAGLNDDAKFQTAQAQWAGATSPIRFINDSPATFYNPQALSQNQSIYAHADIAWLGTGALFTGYGSNTVACWPGVNLYGPSSKASGVDFFTASSGAHYDFGAGCNIYNFERGILLPKSVSDVAIHDVVDAHDLYSLAYIGGSATTTGFAADQPTGIRFYRNNIHDSTLGLDDYYSHGVEAWGNRMVNLTLYGLTGAGGNAADYVAPSGSMSGVNYHDNYYSGVTAGEFVVKTIGARLGSHSLGNNCSDYCFGVEGGTQTEITDATCTGDPTSTTNACVATEFKASQVIVARVNSTHGGIIIKNSGQTASDVTDYQIKDSTVPGILLEPFQNLELSGNHVNGAVQFVIRHDGVYMHDNWLWTSFTAGGLTCAICGGSTAGGTIDRYDRNMVNLVGTAPTGATAFYLVEANFNFSANIQMTDNTTPGFPTFLTFDSIGGNPGIYPTAHLHFNHRRGAVLRNVNTNGRGTIAEDSTYDANEQLHIIGAQTSPVN